MKKGLAPATPRMRRSSAGREAEDLCAAKTPLGGSRSSRGEERNRRGATHSDRRDAAPGRGAVKKESTYKTPSLLLSPLLFPLSLL